MMIENRTVFNKISPMQIVHQWDIVWLKYYFPFMNIFSLLLF